MDSQLLPLAPDPREDLPHGLGERELRQYAPEIALLRHALDSPEHRFQRYRDTRVRLLADEPLRAEVLRALLRTGCRDIEVVAEPARFGELSRAAEQERRDPDQWVHLTDGADAPDVPGVPRTGAVLEVRTVRGNFETARRALIATAQHCAAAGLTPAQLLVGDDEVWFGPTAARAAAAGWLRLLPPSGGTRQTPLDGAVPGLLAHRLVLSLFLALTGLDELPPAPGSPADPVLTRTDLRTLAGSRHPALPHPAAATAGLRAAGTEQPTPPTPSDESGAELLARTARVVDARTGLLGAVDEADFSQSPLRVCRAVPHGYRGGPLDAPAIGSGLEREEARLAAVLAGLAAYAADAAACRTADEGLAAVEGVDLADGRPVLIPASAAFPERAPGTRLRGAAGGRSPEEAHWHGLADQVEALLALPAHPAGRITALDPADFTADPRTAQLLRLLEADGEPALYDLTTVTGVPACATRLGPAGQDPRAETVAAAGRDLAEAVARAAERAVLARQCRTEGRPAYRPETVPGITALAPVAAAAQRSDAPGTDLAALAAALRATTGLRAVAVPLDRDPLATAVLPGLTRVVLLPD